MRKNTFFHWTMDGENIEYLDLGITVKDVERREQTDTHVGSILRQYVLV